MDPIPNQPGWERELITKLAQMNVKEQRARRRWGILFKLIMLALLVFFIAVGMGWIKPPALRGERSGPHTALVKLEGEISSNSMASAENINAALAAAFKDADSVAVILNINSPGGSPVQSARIYSEIKRLRQQYPNKPLYAVVDELCASGGYYVAAAADKIYVNGSSIVGSIGVIYRSLGLDQVIEKLGIENRTITAGENKAFLDPLSPLNPEHKAHLETMLADVQHQFVRAVKEGRGARLKESTPGLFSGLLWSGDKAIENGLVDEIGSVDSVARDVVKAEKVIDYTIEETPFEKLSRRLGSSFGAGVMESVNKAGWR